VVITQPKDTEGFIISGAINSVVSIQNINATTAGWTAVTTDADIQKFILQARDNISWRLSLTDGGSYATIRPGASFSSSLVVASGTLLCYVQPIDTDTTFELICAR
jgi:hypothetical protein